jgi:hypothetical protein
MRERNARPAHKDKKQIRARERKIGLASDLSERRADVDREDELLPWEIR